MRTSKEELSATLESEEVAFREVEWGEMQVGFETYHEEFDIGPLLEGLPNDRCQCPHWGYVLKGRMRVRYDEEDREEVVEAGEAYYLPPGHAPVMEAGTEIVEFSPKDEYRKTMEVAERNFAAMMEPGC